MRCGCCRGRWRWGAAALLVAPLALLALNLRLHRLLPLQGPPPPPPPQQPLAFHPRFKLLLNELTHKLTPSKAHDITFTWNTARKWTNKENVFSLNYPIGEVLTALRTAKIIRAENSRKGTQFKLLLGLEGNGTAFFKPQWYKRNEVIRGSVYSGKDRHNAEVVAFYLAVVLDIRWAPLAIIRRLNIKTEVWNNATPELKETMFQTDNGTMCMFGKCFYCKRNETVCSDENDEIEGAMILSVDYRFQKYRSPWQRTYDDRRQADWEVNPNYCTKVKKVLTMQRLLDLIDASIFDFLLQNGDRHHYETIKDRVILLDNGKGLGNPHKDFNDILAPLYQCCILRLSTWKRLKLLSGGYLTTTLSELLSEELGGPVLTELHLQAMERRLLTIYATVEACITEHGKSILKTNNS
ncbi:glycosaminoglycan xylosylkinase homolog [Arctopsyche grandis]|uniref:glycosaminoglycan xylosylkinase homolog n=1 Tax=Arctopsyche grandis TaxID=121162 RepID=UPI00406D7193